MSSTVKVATRAELPPGSRKLVEVHGQPVALFNINGAYHAVDDVCTHDGGPLADGALSDCEIECPRHGARFDIRSGRALCMPAIEPITVHKVELRGDDLYVTLNE